RGTVRARHRHLSRDEGNTRQQLVPGARPRRRGERAARGVRRARQPGEGRRGFGAAKLQRAVRLPRNDGTRGASAVAMTHDVLGFTVGTAAAGVRDGTPSRTDVALIASDRICAAAGVFTTNQVIAAPCVVTRRHLEQGRLRAIVVNSGNANACTGEQGERHAVMMARAAAQRIGCDAYEVAVASTGVIGVPLPVERIMKALKGMGLRPGEWIDVAKAIMTTDTKPKSIGIELPLEAGAVHLRGIAKGAGMIHPNMATMLAFLVTDAEVAAEELQEILEDAADESFNVISIDGDTSTNDTLLALANGQSGIKLRGHDLKNLGTALR